MRFRKRRKNDSTAQESTERHPSRSQLGIFTPAAGTCSPDPQHVSKRLAELDAIFIRSKKLESLEDVPYVVNQIREGNIVLLDISRLNCSNEQAQLELKRIIERIRGETRGFRAEMALVNDGCIIVTPSFVKF